VLTASDGRVEAARFRLLALGFFLDVRLALERGSERGGAVLVVDVEERNTVILNALYLGASTATPFWGGLDVAENNLFGRGISLGGGFVAAVRPQVAEAGQDFGARLRGVVPPLGGTGLMLSATGIAVTGSEFFRVSGSDSSADPANFVALRTTRIGGVVGLGRGLTQATRFFLDFREEGITSTWPMERMRVNGSGPGTPLDFGVSQGYSRLGSLTATVDFDTRSDPLMPRAGTHLTFSVEGADDDLGSNYEFLKLVLQGSIYRPAWQDHFFGVHVFGGALYGDAPLFDRFFIGDMNLFLPPRALGLNFSTQPSRNLLGTSIVDHRYDHFAARVLFEYAVPLWRRHRLVYSGDAFIAFGAFGMGSKGNFRDPGRSGFAAWPVDLTGDLGVRLDTTIGVFTLSFANALGRVPF
jgi:outer membrane protein insertion porin family